MEYQLSGFNGERPDPISRHSHPGNGYRAYNPALGRFNIPDDWSPFGAGGLNPYVYCVGDPVNRTDPSGHVSLGPWISAGVGYIAGTALSIVTEGAAIPAVLALIADVTGNAVIGAATELVTEAFDGQRVNWGQVGIAAVAAAAVSRIGELRRLNVNRSARFMARRPALTKTIITWGKNIHAPLILDDRAQVYHFTDMYRGYPRLNIVAHGDVDEKAGFATLQLTGRYEGKYTGSTFADLLEEKWGMDFKTFTYARTIVCGSANGEHLSFAQGFALRSGLRTKGFLNAVTTESHLETLIDFWHMMNQCDPLNFDLQTLDHSLKELNNMPDKAIFHIRKTGVNWQPRPFDPPLLAWEQPYRLKSIT